jgi:hypothetical protein
LIRGSPRSLLDLSENEMFNDFNTGGWLGNRFRFLYGSLLRLYPVSFRPVAGCHPAVRSLLAERPDEPVAIGSVDLIEQRVFDVCALTVLFQQIIESLDRQRIQRGLLVHRQDL